MFFEGADYLRYLQELRELALRRHCAVHAYVLMTNHVHLLLTPGAVGQVATGLRADLLLAGSWRAGGSFRRAVDGEHDARGASIGPELTGVNIAAAARAEDASSRQEGWRWTKRSGARSSTCSTRTAS